MDKKTQKKIEPENFSEDEKNTFNPTDELLHTEIEKYEKNIEYLKKLVNVHKELIKEDKEISADLGSNVLTDLLERIKELEKQLLTKKLELKYHKNIAISKDFNEKKTLNYDHFYLEKPKEWKKRFLKWQKNVIRDENEKITKKRVIEEFKPYKKDIFLRFTYDIVGSKIPYPFNCFVLTLLLLPIIILPFYFVLGPESFYIEGPLVGLFESTTFMMVVVLIPTSLIVLKEIFKRYKQTFEKLRDIAKVSDKDYQEFISLANWTLQSPSVKYFWIGAWIVMTALCLNLYNNPKPIDLVDDVGIFGLISLIIVYNIAVTIVISLSWYLLSIVRTIRRFISMPLDIRPLDPDNAAGLKPLSQLSFNLSLVSLLGVFGVMYALFIGGRTINEPTTILFLICLVIMMILLFLLPLSNAHNVMDEQKSKY